MDRPKSWKVWLLPMLLWLFLISGDLVWNFFLIDNNITAIANDKGESFFKLVEITRIWNARHGGVYAMITKDNKPNPYLEVPNRDIVTVDGLELTMVNPAYMTRQIAEIAKEKNDIVFHITSLTPIRPENAADKWETTALVGFENGENEMLELTVENSKKFFRYMAPLVVKRACIKCHGKHGYKVGDIRGGISVTMPAEKLLTAGFAQKRNQIFLHLGFLIIGAFCIFYFRICSHRYWVSLKKSNEQLRHAGKLASIGKLSASVAHEFNNPIFGIRNVLLLVSKKLATGNIDDDDKSLVDAAVKECDRVSGLIKTLREFYSPSKGVKLLIDINETVNDIELIYSKKLKERKIEFDKLYDDNIPQIEAVPDQIKQVVLNLLQNAEDAIGDGGGKISLTTELDGSNVFIHIKDTGSGIPKEDINAIFDPFFTTKSESKGTGLGLSVCHGIIQSHKGDIKVKSKVGEGATFSVMLPIWKDGKSKPTTRDKPDK